MSDHAPQPLPRVTWVIPVYNEAEALEHNLTAIRDVVRTLPVAYEFVVVDDGSTDGTWEALQRWGQTEPRLHAYRLSRNFGKEAALCAGLDRATGDASVVMDSDLQHPPSALPEMIRLWREEGYPIVEGVKRRRGREGWINRLGAKLFYGFMRRLAGMDLRQASDFKLLDARILAAWRLLKERQTFFRGLTNWIGFRRARVYFDVAPRSGGGSKWPPLRLVKYALSALTSFSSLPMQVVTTLGLLFLLGAVPLGIQTLVMKITGRAVDGFTTVITLLLVIGSVLMISLGIIGSYIARIFEEVKHRPRYLVADRLTPPAEETDKVGD